MRYRIEDRGHDTPCWVWQGAVQSSGYATVYVRGVGCVLAHRVFYEAHVAAIPKGLDLDHLCRVRTCVNPEHLEPVTRQVNLRRGAGTKLTLEQILEIRTSPESARSIALRIGIDPSHAAKIRRGLKWNDEVAA